MKKTLAIILSLVVLAGLIVSVAALFAKKSSSAPAQGSTSQSSNSSSTSPGASGSSSASATVSLSEVKKNNGLSGNPCWIAVERTVYLVPVGTKDWSNGMHMKTNGQIKCGMDTGSMITSSPHGTSVLRDLKKIGTLE